MYAGDKECREVFAELSANANAALVDVRTTREWEVIGVPDLSGQGHEVIFEEWQMYPSMSVNPDFARHVDELLQARGTGKDDPVFFLCRSGARSQGAAGAMTQLGYTKAYNVLSGFEGVPDESGERMKVNGWVHDGLPARLPDKNTA